MFAKFCKHGSPTDFINYIKSLYFVDYFTRCFCFNHSRKKEEARFYGIASQIKLLLDMPEKVCIFIYTCKFKFS